VERVSESISGPVVGIGSLSALIVLTTSGTLLRRTRRGSGAPLYRTVFEKHRGCFET